MADQKSRILIIGGSGYLGKYIVGASAKAGHPTFALVRESTLSDPVKGKLIENFNNLGVTLLHVHTLILFTLSLIASVYICVRWALYVWLCSGINVGTLQGDLHDHESLVKAIKLADVVISAVGYTQVAEQVKIIAAIKEAGNVKVWFYTIT